MKNPLFKTAVALTTTFAVTTQIVAAPLSGKAQTAKAQTAIPQNKPLPFDTIPARGGVIKITPIIHASIQIEYRGTVILVDPISAGTYRKKADFILITHPHPDHFDPALLKKITGAAEVIIPRSKLFQQAWTASKLERLVPSVKLGNQERLFLGLSNYRSPSRENIVTVESVPAYNIKRGPDATHKFHPKGAFNGYILTLGGKRIYIAGDTEATPEMKALKNIDAAFIPMNLPYTMTPQEAAVGVRAFKPKIVYPYHFRYPFNQPNTNPQQFIRAMKGSGVSVRVLDWYNAVPVARFMAAMKKQ